MIVKIESPSKARIDQYSSEELDFLYKELTYKNTSIEYDIKRHYDNNWFRNKNPIGWQNKLNELKSSLINTLVFKENDKIYIRPGSISYLNSIGKIDSYTEFSRPEFTPIPWFRPLPFELYSYQKESVKKLLDIKHGNIQLCTGAGKTAIALTICKNSGLNTAIIAPSISIFNELLEKFEYHFGKGKVGAFGAGKKRLDKKFTICIGDSLVNIKRETPEWDFFSNLDMLIIDESHLWGAETLHSVCHDLLADIPYRFFMSGTQTRGDGTEKLLQSIIGPTVYSLTTKEAIAGSFICPHDFTILEITSSNPNYNSKEPLEMKRIHFLKNTNIAKFIAKLANTTANECGMQTLVLVEELSQIAMLIKLLEVPFAYAHSEKNKARLSELNLKKVDSKDSVLQFNKNEVKVLIGTSCISTGTNIYPTHNTINWVGGSSEIKTKQGVVGRSVRLHDQNPWKNKCIKKNKAKIYDFDVYDIYIMRKHLQERLSYYHDSGTEVKRIKLNVQENKTGGIR